MAKNVHYHPLLNDAETDSDVDIYDSNLKPKYDRNARVKRLGKAVVGFVILALIVFVAVYTTIHVKSDKTFHTTSTITKPVHTECGMVAGTKEVVQEKVAFTFKGIPYAKPPVGELRWRAPVRLSENPSDCWDGVYTANTFGTQCVQGDHNDSEDCLFLNIYTPSLNRMANLPVFVWIHGGYLMNGNGSQNGYHPDSEFVTSMNVVGVSMNYRLNAFGFLTLEELWVPGKSYGNYGLMDQILVLKWIQKNIRNFGGDPNLVTVSGQSSGGTSIFGLLASPITDGLFHRAIPISGSPKLEMSYKNASIDNFKFVKLSGKCRDMERGEKLRQCLYNMKPVEVLQSLPVGEYPAWDMSDLIDFPTKGQLYGALIVVDDIVVKVPPKDFSVLNIHKNVSVLIGNTAQEAGFGPKHMFTDGNGWYKLHGFFKERLDDFNKTFIAHVWNNLYANATFSTSYNTSAQLLFETITTDVRCTCPANKLAKDLAKSQKNKIYRYVVEYAPEKPVRLPFVKHGAWHAFHVWDAMALFGLKAFLPYGYVITPKDRLFIKNLRKSFKWFMLHGNLDADKWSAGKTGVYQSDAEVHVQDDYHGRQCQFWSDKQNGFLPYVWIN